MQLSQVAAFWLRLAGNILLDLFLYVQMFCSPSCAHGIIRRLNLVARELWVQSPTSRKEREKWGTPHFPLKPKDGLNGPPAHPGCGRSAEDGSSRVPLPSGRTPRPFAVRVPRGPHSTPPTVRAGPTPTVAGCSRAAPERPPRKDSPLAARNPSAPPIRPDPTTLRPRPDSPACFAIATPSPAPRPPSALRSRRWTTFQVQDAGSTPRARHRADADRVAMGWLVAHRWAPHRQDSLGLEFGMLRTSLPSVLPVDCVRPNISWSRPSHPGSQSHGCDDVTQTPRPHCAPLQRRAVSKCYRP